MKIIEVEKDLFTVDEEYYLAHCISLDFALGAGIAVQFDKKFNMREKLNKACNEKRKYESWESSKNSSDNGEPGYCLALGNVFNLVTKEKYFDKPTYGTIENALYSMKKIASTTGVENIAMPRIGCGLDQLEWSKVKSIIKEVFKDTDIKIMVCIK